MKDKISLFIKKRRKAIFAYMSSLISLVSGFLLIIIVNKLSGVDIYGQFSLIVASTTLITKFLSSRTSEAIIKFYIRSDLDNDRCKMQLTIFISLTIDFVSASLIYLIINYYSDIISEGLLKTEINNELWLYSLVVVMVFMKSSLVGYLQAKNQLNTISIINSIESIVKITTLYLLFKHVSSSLENIVLSVVFSTFLSYFSFLILAIYYLYRDKMFFKPSLNFTFVKEYFRFTATTFVSSTLKGINQGGDVIILGIFTNPSIVGVYDSVKKITNISTFPSLVMPFLYASKISEWGGGKKYGKIKNVIFYTTLKLLLVSSSVATVIVLFGDEFLEYFSIDEGYNNILYILLVGSLLNVSVWWGRIYSNIIDPFISLYVNVFISLYLVTFSTSMTYLWGLEGMASSIAVMNVGVFIIFIKLSKLKAKDATNE
ncbi:putative Polysaccharide biosynthesis protein [Vibrio crassostreae]|uniref:lipopolysaccharide biosynthesis protein n=1 Tax=Vibrio crassostreae TaxID=246167 RepID=UPI001B305442|nr:oligosaccharide flippase family protein [Vibrio crassostreae]CAK1934636.1 putative Polysaccharide biosynthesis protein [Vibrio crassostreae]CAK1939921.1 putative Polysaccharide biosynthesis protein [Vibrio crassostreae]CAK1940698.1 putative Polysaccharide biosynthesis protein [Vibrio crassostreae]CAK1945400.1 putative Polysaccharide biosynthesis protein [Vibrio crassostreae]CAK1946494.1 putative Polysaccharide biosynthesis protein [Vibrio crassostreae]